MKIRTLLPNLLLVCYMFAFSNSVIALGRTKPKLSRFDRFKVEIRDYSPKFLTFYKAANLSNIDEPSRWALFEKLDGFLAVPPTPEGKEEGRKLLKLAWNRYPASLTRISLGAAALNANPQQCLNNVVSLLSGSKNFRGKPEKIVVIPFVGTFDGNAFASKTFDGNPLVAIPIEVSGSDLTMTHEFTHIVNQAFGGLWKGDEQTIATLMFTEGLAMKVTQRLHPGIPESRYASLIPQWFVDCENNKNDVLKGLYPHLMDKGSEAISKFTYGNGASGLTREVYCGGWFTVAYLLQHNWSFPALARLNRSQINVLVSQTVRQMLDSTESNSIAKSKLLTDGYEVHKKDITERTFRGRIYEPINAPKKNTSIVLIGGTEGHLYTADDIGPKLAGMGYVVLGVDYHDAYDNGRKFANIPIESFTSAVT